MRHITLFFLSGLFIFGSAQTWTRMNPSNPPSPREKMAMAYDSESDRIILFGGNAGPTIFNETWEYDFNTDTWTQLSPPTSPPGICAAAMVCDSKRDRMILFGGSSVSGILNDTWAYDLNTNTWSNLNPSNPPPARHSHCMAYDSESDRVVLFGGYNGRYLHDTWEYDPSTNAWIQRSPASHPPGGFILDGMVYDIESDRCIQFGGYAGSGYYSDQTWAYDANTSQWTLMSPASRPSPRSGVHMAYDSESDRIILFGGYRSSNCYDDTWEYDYNTDTWTNPSVSTRPTARGEGAMVYDGESDRAILFGGDGPSPGNMLGDTWAYDEPLKVLEKGSAISGLSCRVFPNPSLTQATVLLSQKALRAKELRLYDSGGRLVMRIPINSKQVTIGQGLAPGIYFINLGDSGLIKVVKLGR